MSFSKYLVGAVTALCFMPLQAEPVDEATRARILSKVEQVVDGATDIEVNTTPVDGLYEIGVGAGQFLYSNKNGDYVFVGEMYSLQGDEPENLTENKRKEFRATVLKSLDVDDTIVFKPKGETKAIMNVFTDVDCGYCRLFHQEVPELNAKGIEVHYLAFPRGGVQSVGYRKLVSAWCAEDKAAALTSLKSDKSIPARTCDNPVVDQYNMGGAFGVRGTPALVLMDGTLIPGYKKADELIDLLGL
jgi:thiol:disulfide interchange protein DsbC